MNLGVLTVLEVTGAVSGSVPAPRPGPLIRVIVVIIGIVVGVLVGVVGVVAHHAVYVAGRPQVTELRGLWRRSPVPCAPGGPTIAGPRRREASFEPVAGGGPGTAGGDPRRARCPRAGRGGAVVTQQQNGRARLRGGVAVGARGRRGAGVASPLLLRLVLRPEAQQTEHLPIVLPLDRLAPGARGGGGLTRGLRGAAEKRTELQWPQQEHGPGETHGSPGESFLRGGRGSDPAKEGDLFGAGRRARRGDGSQ